MWRIAALGEAGDAAALPAMSNCARKPAKNLFLTQLTRHRWAQRLRVNWLTPDDGGTGGQQNSIARLSSVINWGAPVEPFEKREPDDRSDKGAYLIIISLLSYPCCRSGSGRRFGRSSLLLLLACGDSQVHRLRSSTVGIATNQRSNQVQERLVFGMSAATA